MTGYSEVLHQVCGVGRNKPPDYYDSFFIPSLKQMAWRRQKIKCGVAQIAELRIRKQGTQLQVDFTVLLIISNPLTSQFHKYVVGNCRSSL